MPAAAAEAAELLASAVAHRRAMEAALEKAQAARDPAGSWPVTENGNGYVAAYILMLARYAR